MEQLAFLKNRCIFNGVVVLNKAMADVRKSWKKSLFFKAGFVKAYDSFNWNYLLELMTLMNFPDKWVAWVRECNTIVKANILVNGSPSWEFTLERRTTTDGPSLVFPLLNGGEGVEFACEEGRGEGVVTSGGGRERDD